MRYVSFSGVLTIGISILLVSVSGAASAQTQVKAGLVANSSIHTKSKLNQNQAPTAKPNWISIQELNAMVQSKDWAKKKRPVIVDVYTEWCGWCKKMDAGAFSDPKVVEYINKYFYAVKLDAETREDITFGSQTFQFISQGKRGTHMIAYALAADNSGRMGYPTLAFLDKDLKRLEPRPGFRTPEDMLLLLSFIKEEAYTSKTLEEYKSK